MSNLVKKGATLCLYINKLLKKTLERVPRTMLMLSVIVPGFDLHLDLGKRKFSKIKFII